MAHGSLAVTFNSPDTSRIPERLTEGASLLMDLRHRGILAAVGDRLHIRRQGGYCGLDVWLTLLLYFAACPGQGIRMFWEETLRPHVQQLAALAGRRSLPASASLSRALNSVEPELLRESSNWLLTGASEVDEVLRHPAVQMVDAQGHGWHGFDLDPTVTTLRQRALPEDDDLPEPRRRSENTGAPGHSGRKRGNIQFRRITVQHSGSGVWVHGHLSPGNGEGVIDFYRSLDTVGETVKRLGHPLDRTLLRMDGEYGNVPWFTACREHGLPFVTRLNRPKLFEDPDVLDRLRLATWYRVPDSLSGPQRAAADIGVLTVSAGKDTQRPDGSGYDPVRIRVVASIFPRDGAAQRGRTLDGWQVELFAVDLPADAWPAPDAIAAYFGRTAEENRFGQEDRELGFTGLDRIISYHLPGQELATLVGLSLWNLRLARGFERETPPHKRPAQALRLHQVDQRVTKQWPRDPVIRNILAELDWPTLLAQRPRWQWDDVSGELHCPDGRGLPLTTVRSSEHAKDRTSIIFRRQTGGCEDCSDPTPCLRSEREQTSKHTEISIPTPVAERLRQRLTRVRGKTTRPRTIDLVEGSPGPLMASEALFLPARARQAFVAVFLGASLRIHVETPRPAEPAPRLVAADIPDRQRRRSTWDRNVERYAAPDGTKVRVEATGHATFRRMLGEPHRAATANDYAC